MCALEKYSIRCYGSASCRNGYKMTVRRESFLVLAMMVLDLDNNAFVLALSNSLPFWFCRTNSGPKGLAFGSLRKTARLNLFSYAPTAYDKLAQLCLKKRHDKLYNVS